MRPKEKIFLCITMSLGLVVAIASAIRTEWKFDDGNHKNEWYFWNLAMSNIWYSSEVTGTIIVQCIPVLRPLLKEISSTLRSKRLGSSTGENENWDLGEGANGRWYPPTNSRLRDEGNLVPGVMNGDEETLVLSVRNGGVVRRDLVVEGLVRDSR